MHAYLPQNGRGEQRGLTYAVRNGNLLYVSTHQPDRTQPYRRDMPIDVEWLDETLTQQADARFKLVAGHYPVYPVNGYRLPRLWCFHAGQRQRFWQVLIKHRVDAYLVSHVIAFDTQVHHGVPQIVSGGAWTVYGPDGVMPGVTEFLHATDLTLDGEGLRCGAFRLAAHASPRTRSRRRARPPGRCQRLDVARK